MVFLSFRDTACFIPGPDYYRASLAPFGRVVDTLFRPSQVRELKSFVLVQMETVGQALAVQAHFAHPTQGSARRRALGGTALEVSVLSEPQEAGNAFSIIQPNIVKHLGEAPPSRSGAGGTHQTPWPPSTGRSARCSAKKGGFGRRARRPPRKSGAETS